MQVVGSRDCNHMVGWNPSEWVKLLEAMCKAKDVERDIETMEQGGFREDKGEEK